MGLNDISETQKLEENGQQADVSQERRDAVSKLAYCAPAIAALCFSSTTAAQASTARFAPPPPPD